MKKLFTLVFAFGIVFLLSANNITVSNLSLTGKNATDNFTLVQFDISWENSWLTSSAPNNWDAAWVFVIYRVTVTNGGDGLWHHAWLNNTGHTAPAGSTIDIGLQSPGSAFNATTNPGLGAFFYRSADGAGEFNKTGVQLRWNYGSNYKTGTTPIGDDDIVDVQVFAIEMVCVPEGTFTLGSGGTESGSFTNGSWSTGATAPLSISSESALTIAHTTGNLWGTSESGNNTIGSSGTLAAAFPKGYGTFYCMKYEISQQQYVDFLNTLTSTQASNRYSSGSTGHRYGLSVSGGVYSTTNPYVACNYLSWMDGAAYTDWAGLRPMTEMEFEKACRGTATPLANEYAWGNTTATSAKNITNGGANNETTNTSEANAVFYDLSYAQEGPMRTGVFATGSATRVQAGSTYYGMMEMSGNLWERTVTVGNASGRAFTGVHGNGTLSAAGNADISTWPGYVTAEVTGATGSGLRGGSFTDNYICISDRILGALDWSNRLNNDGFRAVRSIALPSLTTTGATSISFTTATSGGNITSDDVVTITARGVCYSTTTNPAIAGSHTTDGNGSGIFASSLSGLASNTTYYIRAYATTTRGTAYGNEVSFTTLGTCGSFTINHVTSGGAAAVTKTVTYGTVTGIPGVTTKCWITSNLGADRQALAVDDATEESAGWYWQFNRKQGYKHDGTALTPSWPITSINEYSDWIPANDPCALELGPGWRIPTYTEWADVDAGGGWTNWNGPWSSGLKLHAAGGLGNGDGSLYDRGSYGNYWSSTQGSGIGGWYLYFDSGDCYMHSSNKAYGFTLRCLREMIPTVSTTEVSNIGATTATGGGNVISECGSMVTAKGACWSTTTAPTISDSHTSDGTGAGTFSSTITGLSENTLYYVRAYATNSIGTAYGNLVTCTTATAPFICGTSSITISHTAGTVAPVTKAVTYGTVTNIPGETTKCWITSNLGADHQATAVDDATEASAGWYWQFNRKQGYKHDGTDRTPNTTWITSISENSDWETSNDPCGLELGSGWRIPTNTEWNNVVASGSWTIWNGPWNSGLKMHAAGILSNIDGSLRYRGSNGLYWSSTQDGSTSGRALIFSSSYCYMYSTYKASGHTLRCLRDMIPTVTTTAISNVGLTTATGGGNVISECGSTVTARGVCWSTTTAPTISDSHTSDGTGAGTFSSTITGLSASTLYYVRAFASNGAGTAYGNQVTCTTSTAPFICGTTSITISHTAGTVAPVTKAVTYGTVTNIPGETTKCWITSNLGADHQATAVDDATEASAGWYWQFNRKQGYKHDGTTRTPNTTWITSIIESSDWIPVNDPCALELGAGWRIPTNTEWTNVDVSGNWTDWNGPWNSGLKLHAAGYLYYGDGSLYTRGLGGSFWSSTQYEDDFGWYLHFDSGNCGMDVNNKANGLSLRCVRDY